MMLCLKEAKTLGKDAFLQKYGQTEPLAACRTQQQAAAQALVRSAVAACKQSSATPDAVPACVKQKLMAALGTPGSDSSAGKPGTAPAQALVQKVAMALCLKEARSLGKDAFLEKYGQTEPFAACRAQHQAAAQALVQSALTACKESSTTPASFAACVMQRLQSVLGPPPSTTTHP